MAKPNFIELPGCEPMPILFEDRSVIAVDKPRDWMLLPVSWQNTGFNLQAALNSSIAAGDFWARSRGVKFLRYIHRLDGDTSGILLLAKSVGALESFGALFESRRMEKTYLAVVVGLPRENEWTCQFKLAPDPQRIGRMMVDMVQGKDSETQFRVLEKKDKITLVEARPLTGRTHQIRVHLAESGCPILGDDLYWGKNSERQMGLRAVRLAYNDPFTRRRVEIRAPVENFLKEYGFQVPPGFKKTERAAPEHRPFSKKPDVRPRS